MRTLWCVLIKSRDIGIAECSIWPRSATVAPWKWEEKKNFRVMLLWPSNWIQRFFLSNLKLTGEKFSPALWVVHAQQTHEILSHLRSLWVVLCTIVRAQWYYTKNIYSVCVWDDDFSLIFLCLRDNSLDLKKKNWDILISSSSLSRCVLMTFVDFSIHSICRTLHISSKSLTLLILSLSSGFE